MPTIISPVPPVLEADKRLAAPPPSLAGLRISVLDNSKANAGRLLGDIVDALVGQEKAIRGIIERKSSSSIPATPAALERLCRGSDLVLAGSADCGSCSSGSVQDAVALEGAGIPCVLVGTEIFASLIGQLAAWLGTPDLRVALTAHPLGGIDKSEVAAKALALAPVVRDIATAAAS
jgi:hypothetical protein